MDGVMYGCESWIIKKAEWQRIDAFELWCWRRLLRVPYTARITHQSILKEINIICIFIGRTYAKAPTLWPPDEKIWLIRKCPDAGKDWRQERRGQQRVRWLDGFTNTVDLSLSNFWRWWRTGKTDMLQFMVSQRVGQYWVTEQQQKG